MKLIYALLLAVAWSSPKVELSSDGTTLTITSIYYEGKFSIKVKTTDNPKGEFTLKMKPNKKGITFGTFEGKGSKKEVKFSKVERDRASIKKMIDIEKIYYKGKVIHPIHIVTDPDIKKKKAVDPKQYKGVHIGLFAFSEEVPDDYLLRMIGIKIGGKIQKGIFGCHPHEETPGEWKEKTSAKVWGTYEYYDGTNLVFDNSGVKTKKTLAEIADAVVKKDITYKGDLLEPEKGNVDFFDYDNSYKYNYYPDNVYDTSFIYLFGGLLSLGLIGVCCCLCVGIGFIAGYVVSKTVNSSNYQKLSNHFVEEQV